MNAKLIVMTVCVVLLLCCFASPNFAQESLVNFVPDKDAIVVSVLKAELQRQSESFQKIRTLSTENISHRQAIEVDGERFKLVDGVTLRDSVKEGSYIEYLMFASFRREGESVVVTIAHVVEGDGCFGPYYKRVNHETYVAHKDALGWRAEFRYSSSPLLPMKPLGRGFLVNRK